MKTTNKKQKTTRGKLITNAYLAGIIDGEGSIFVSKINNKKSGNIWYRLQISCSMTEPQAVELLREFTPNRKQLIYRDGKHKGYKPVYQWCTTGGTAMSILKELEPYLLVKKNQAQLGIEFQTWRETLPNTGRKRTQKDLEKFEKYYLDFKALK